MVPVSYGINLVVFPVVCYRWPGSCGGTAPSGLFAVARSFPMRWGSPPGAAFIGTNISGCVTGTLCRLIVLHTLLNDCRDLESRRSIRTFTIRTGQVATSKKRYSNG
jgi:hypothetical protein